MTARPPVTETLARFASAPERPPESARRTARLSAADMLTVALAGLDEPVSQAARALASGGGSATALGLDAPQPAPVAALANGTAGHALDYDDTQFDYVGHPSVAVFPAAWAVAESLDASGAALLDAFAVGAEVSCRVGTWFGAAHYNLGFHQTGTAGCFGATAAAARLMGLGAARTAHALGLAATRAAGLKAQFGTMGKPLNAGFAAANGVEAALLAGAGAISAPDGIEGAQGFAETHGVAFEGWEAAAEGLGAEPPGAWRFERVQYKRHACCHGLHAALEALGGLRARIGAPEAVAAVEIRTAPRWLKVCDIPEPATGLEAKFSYRLTAAMALSGISTAALSSYSAETCAEPGLVALRDRVLAIGDPALSDTETAVSIGLADGERLEAVFDLAAPIPAAALEAQLKAKSAALLGPADAERLWTAVDALETGPARALAGALPRGAV